MWAGRWVPGGRKTPGGLGDASVRSAPTEGEAIGGSVQMRIARRGQQSELGAGGGFALKPANFYDLVVEVAIVPARSHPGRHGASVS
jgi:hypothetical protein